MKLKTLLLGSAAAMIAVSGARAADAVIVAEPEPMEYVKVCDLYGAGFHYIPGTETCLKFDGYVRVDFTFGDDGGTPGVAAVAAVTAPIVPTGATAAEINAANLAAIIAGQTVTVPATVVGGVVVPGLATVTPAVAAVAAIDDEFSRWDYRVRVNIDARNETDYGTLRSEIRIQGDAPGTAADANAVIDRALIHLAGFRLGYSDSFTTTFHGYGVPVEKYDGFYGYDQAIFLDYTYAANGFEAGIGVQDSVGGFGTADREVDADFYAGLAYGGSWGRVAASYIYETDIEEGAYKVSASLNLIEGLTVKGFVVGDEDGTTRQVQGASDFNWGVGAAYQFTPEFRLHAAYNGTEGGGGRAVGGDDHVVVGAIYNPVAGLSLRPELAIGVDDSNDDSYEFSMRVYRTW